MSFVPVSRRISQKGSKDFAAIVRDISSGQKGLSPHPKILIYLSVSRLHRPISTLSFDQPPHWDRDPRAAQQRSAAG
jgi:hypothetical protein